MSTAIQDEAMVAALSALSLPDDLRTRDGRLLGRFIPGATGEPTMQEETASILGDDAMTEQSWPKTPEQIAELVRRMDNREPLEWQPGEYEAWLAELERHREWEAEDASRRSEQLERAWE